MDVVITSAVRTPVGSFNGALSSLTAHQLGEIVIRESLARSKTDAADVSEVILGQILSAGQGQNPARQASVNAGVPYEVPAFGRLRLAIRRSSTEIRRSSSPAARKA